MITNRRTLSRIIISLGTNHDKYRNMSKAKDMLCGIFGSGISFTRSVETKPIGVVSADYLNALAVIETGMSYKEAEGCLKGIERECGRDRTKEPEVAMDIDILEYNGKKERLKDWERGYVKALMDELALD